MIIIEGADHTGKTTFAKSFELPYRHMLRPDANYDHLTEYVKGIFPGVQDRYHIGSVVYGMMLRSGSHPTYRQMKIIHRYLQWAGCYIIIMHCDPKVLRQRLEESDRDEMYKIPDILAANDAYRSIMKNSIVNASLCIDVTDKWPGVEERDDILTVWKRVYGGNTQR